MTVRFLLDVTRASRLVGELHDERALSLMQKWRQKKLGFEDVDPTLGDFLLGHVAITLRARYPETRAIRDWFRLSSLGKYLCALSGFARPPE
jgi:hypothetical protein